jgi:glycosyltransferase involved in cell wall biosynthesis
MADAARRIRVGLLAYGLERPATGIGRYTTEVMRAISAHQPDIELILLTPFTDVIAGLEDLPRVRLRGTRLLPAMMVLGPAQLAITARRHRLDAVHDPVGIAPFFSPGWPSNVGRVVTIHDMVPFVHPETHARLTNLLFHKYMPRTVQHVDRVITDSESSKRDIERFFAVDPGRISRIYCGIGQQFRPQIPETIAEVSRRYDIHSPYILAVGALQARKNMESVIEAYARMRTQHFPHRLVLVGPKAWKSQGIFQRIDQLGLDQHVQLTGFVDDQDLPAIYAGADCFVFPSLYEGFGFPPLEAMACGTPVVASNTSSLPEVIGDGGLMVAPQDVSALATAIIRVLTEPNVARGLRQRGIVQAKRFTWETAAAAHAELYQAVTFHKSHSSITGV